jgi:hypothetical protein
MSADPAFLLGLVDHAELHIRHTSTSGCVTTHMRKDLP